VSTRRHNHNGLKSTQVRSAGGVLVSLESTTQVPAPPTQLRKRRTALSPVHLLELKAIWKEDKRVPSIASRRAWAVSRNSNLTSVVNWFSRKIRAAKLAGEPIPQGSYELPLESYIVHLSPLPVIRELDFGLSSDDTRPSLGLGDNNLPEYFDSSSSLLADQNHGLSHSLFAGRSEEGAYMRQPSSIPAFDTNLFR